MNDQEELIISYLVGNFFQTIEFYVKIGDYYIIDRYQIHEKRIYDFVSSVVEEDYPHMLYEEKVKPNEDSETRIIRGAIKEIIEMFPSINSDFTALENDELVHYVIIDNEEDLENIEDINYKLVYYDLENKLSYFKTYDNDINNITSEDIVSLVHAEAEYNISPEILRFYVDENIIKERGLKGYNDENLQVILIPFQCVSNLTTAEDILYPDPYAEINECSCFVTYNSPYVWSLKDSFFDISVTDQLRNQNIKLVAKIKP